MRSLLLLFLLLAASLQALSMVDAPFMRGNHAMAYDGAQSDASFAGFRKAIEADLLAILHGRTSEFRFVYSPLMDPEASAPRPAVFSGKAGLLLDSPWIQVSETGQELCIVIFWDERQFLVDQISIEAGEPIPLSPRTPLSPAALDAMTDAYAQSVLLVRSPEERQAGLQAIARQIPPDLLWLFRKSWQTTRGPFSDAVDSALRTALERAGPRYIELLKAVLHQYMKNPDIPLHLKNILETKDFFDIETYRIRELT